jgi:regulator of sirC expression with transglutaminase-like and TPR domain
MTMSVLAPADARRPLTENQKAALVKLLADDDIAVYHSIRSKILSYGQEGGQWLRPHTLSGDPVLRRRSQEIIQYLARQAADNRFLGFCVSQGEDLDVEEGAWLLAQTQYPDINIAAYQALFDSYAGDLREQVDFGAGAEDILATINHYLFIELEFSGNEQNYYDPDNSYLNRVVDRRTGNSISLSLVYLFLTRRLKLPVTGIGMPGHFLVRFQSSRGEIYVDAFNRGKLLTKADCVKYLLHTSHGFQEAYLAPISPRRSLLRICSNLHQIYGQLDLAEEVSRLQRYIVALAK